MIFGRIVHSVSHTKNTTPDAMVFYLSSLIVLGNRNYVIAVLLHPWRYICILMILGTLYFYDRNIHHVVKVSFIAFK